MKERSPQDLFKLFDQLNNQTYNIHPLYIELSGSVTSGYLLTQLIFLARAFKYKPFYRTDNELREAYKLGQKELMNARNKLIALGLISTQRLGIPAKLYYTINIEKITQLAIESSDFGDENPPEATDDVSYAQTAQLDLPKGHNSSRRKGITIKNKLHNDLKKNIEEDICTVSGSDSVQEVFEHWKTTLNHPRAKLDKKRKRLLEEALKLYSASDLKQAIDGCASSEWHMGKNERGMVYDSIPLIFRDADKIETFINMTNKKVKPTPTDHRQAANSGFEQVFREQMASKAGVWLDVI